MSIQDICHVSIPPRPAPPTTFDELVAAIDRVTRRYLGHQNTLATHRAIEAAVRSEARAFFESPNWVHPDLPGEHRWWAGVAADTDGPSIHVDAPRYRHDCEECHFLGSMGIADLWVCCARGRTSVIARYSGEPADYSSAPMAVALNGSPELFEARRRALS